MINNDISFIVAIDPGQTSGYMVRICLVEGSEFPDTVIKLYSKKDGYKEFKEELTNIWRRVGVQDIVIYIEDVGKARKGNSASSTASFARHCGFIEGFIEALNQQFDGIVVKYVAPKKWQSWFEQFYHITLAKERGKTKKENAKLKLERKNQIYEVMKKEHGDLIRNQKQADAFAILDYGIDDMDIFRQENKEETK